MVLSDKDDLPRVEGNLTTTRKSRKEIPVFARVERPGETRVTLKKVTGVLIRSGSSEGRSKSGEDNALSSQAPITPPSARRGREFDPLLPLDPRNLMSAKLRGHDPPQIPPISRRGAQVPPHSSAAASGLERMRRYEAGAISGGVTTEDRWWKGEEVALGDVPSIRYDPTNKGEGEGTNNDGKSFSWLQRVEASPDDKYLSRARLRNAARLRLANERDEETLGKYLPDDLKVWFPIRIEGPEDSEVPPKDGPTE